MTNFYHLHINIFSIADATIQKLERIGYKNEPFLYMEGGYAPPMHYEFENADHDLINDYWEKGLKVLEQDNTFKGYIEYETLVDNYSTKYKEAYKFNKHIAFPIPKLKTVKVPFDTFKKSDLHIKRTIDLPYDELDILLLEHGFYEVKTTKHRLYTIQSESSKDMLIIYERLKNYFDKVGGVKALTLEFVNRLVRFPYDFKVVDFLPQNFMKDL
jgi:hypothetical protein